MKNRALGNEHSRKGKKNSQSQTISSFIKGTFLKTINQWYSGRTWATIRNVLQQIPTPPFFLHYQNVKLLYKIQLIGTGKV